MMTHEQFQELLPLYVVGGLDPAEQRDFERYVAAHHARCEKELAEFEAVAADIALSAPPAEPSAEVLDRLMAQIETPSHVKPLPARFVWWQWIPWAATAALACLLVGAQNELRIRNQLFESTRARNAEQASEITQLHGRVENLQIENRQLHDTLERQELQVVSLRKQVEAQESSLALLMEPTIRVAQLGDPGGKTKAAGKAYWDNGKRTGLIVVSEIAPVVKGKGQCIELWTICGNGAPQPAGIGYTDESGRGVVKIRVPQQFACADKFAVSIEPDGGKPSPTGPVVLLGQ